jgi:hypothetical protein
MVAHVSESDIPFADAVERAELAIRAGFTIYQKFTCQHCRSRQTIDVPNAMYMTGLCEECDSTTNIEAQGCGFMATVLVEHE